MTTENEKRVQVGFKFAPAMIEKLDWWAESLGVSKTHLMEESLLIRSDELDRAALRGAAEKLEAMLAKSRSMVGQNLVSQIESKMSELKGIASGSTKPKRRGRMGRK